MKSQKEMVLEHIKKNGKITSMEAFKEYGATRLSAIIYKLKRDGVKISSRTASSKNRFGRECYYSEYFIKGGE